MQSSALSLPLRLTNATGSQAKPFCWANASHIASESFLAAIRADFSSETAAVEVTTLPRPSAFTAAPGAPETVIEPESCTTNTPDRSRFRFRHFA